GVLVVVPASKPAFVSANHVTFAVGTADHFNITAIGSPAGALSLIGKLPSGVTFKDNGNGMALLSGTPAAGTGGTYHVTLVAFNGKSGTQSFTLTVDQVPTVTVQPFSQTVRVRTTATFTAAAFAVPGARVQWQVSTDGGATFKNIKGATSSELRVA